MNAIASSVEIAPANRGIFPRNQKNTPNGNTGSESTNQPADFASALASGLEDVEATENPKPGAGLGAGSAQSSTTATRGQSLIDIDNLDEDQSSDQSSDPADFCLGPSAVFLATLDRPFALTVQPGLDAEGTASGAESAHPEVSPVDEQQSADSSDVETGTRGATLLLASFPPNLVPSSFNAAVVQESPAPDAGIAQVEQSQVGQAPSETLSDPTGTQTGQARSPLDPAFRKTSESAERTATPLVLAGRMRPRADQSIVPAESKADPSAPAADVHDLVESNRFPASLPTQTERTERAAEQVSESAEEAPANEFLMGVRESRPQSAQGEDLNPPIANSGACQETKQNASKDGSMGQESGRQEQHETGEPAATRPVELGKPVLDQNASGVVQIASRAAQDTASTGNPATAVSQPERVLPEQGETHKAPLQAVQIQIQEESGKSVNLRFVESGGEVKVSIRTQDTGLAAALHSESSVLEGRLQSQGWNSEFRPVTGSGAGAELKNQLGAGGVQARNDSTREAGEMPAVRSAQAGMGTGTGTGDSARRQAPSWAEQNEDLMNTTALRRFLKRGVNS